MYSKECTKKAKKISMGSKKRKSKEKNEQYKGV
jgi:hypothetical protein